MEPWPKLIAIVRYLVILTVIFAASMPAQSEDQQKLFKVPAFGDPLEAKVMSQEWQAKPIARQGGADLAIMLSYQIASMLEPAVKRFAEQQGINISIEKGTDGTALSLLERKAVDVSCYCDSPARIDRMPGIQYHALGITPVVFFVHPSNAVNNLSVKDVQKVYFGTIANWSQLGGVDMRIQPVARSHCKTHRGRFKPLENMDELTPRAFVVGSVEDALKYVGEHPGSLGYDMLANVLPLHEQGRLKILSIEGHSPLQLETLRSGAYPYYRTFALTSWNGKHLENPHTNGLISTIVEEVAARENNFKIITPAQLASAGWRFHAGELVGEPTPSANRRQTVVP